MAQEVNLEEAEKAGKVMMELRDRILDTPISPNINIQTCATMLQALALFDIAVILSSPIVEAVQEDPPESLPLFSPGARPQGEAPAPTPEGLLRWAQTISAKGHHPVGTEWDAWWKAVEDLLGPLPPEPKAG